MCQSLSRHGQLSPVVAVQRGEQLEIIDGLKRRAAAEAMGWPTLQVQLVEADEQAQWVLMLSLNRQRASLTVLEEALVLRELTTLGLTQSQVGELVGRHKSWVSRRIGLIERLHPELLEAVKLGMLPAGAARRLLSLPRGNQLELAAVVQQHGLSPRQTEQLVSLWRGTQDPEIRRFLAHQPHLALREAHPESATEPKDPRLTAHGQRLRRNLRIMSGTARRVAELLSPPPPNEDLSILAADLDGALSSSELVQAALGRVVLCSSSAEQSESDGTR